MSSSTRSLLKRLLPASLGKLLAGRRAAVQAREGQVMAAGGGVMLQDNFLPKNDFLAVQRWAFSLPCDVTRKARGWGMEIIRDFDECKCSQQWSTANNDVPAEGQLFIDALRKTGMIEPDATIVLGVYRWQPMSGMGEHTDGHTNTAITYYLNDTWKDNWFGDFIFYETHDDWKRGFGRSVTPIANRLVINKNTVMHKVTYCSTVALERVSVQAFVMRDE